MFLLQQNEKRTYFICSNLLSAIRSTTPNQTKKNKTFLFSASQHYDLSKVAFDKVMIYTKLLGFVHLLIAIKILIKNYKSKTKLIASSFVYKHNTRL